MTEAAIVTVSGKTYRVQDEQHIWVWVTPRAENRRQHWRRLPADCWARRFLIKLMLKARGTR